MYKINSLNKFTYVVQLLTSRRTRAHRFFFACSICKFSLLSNIPNKKIWFHVNRNKGENENPTTIHSIQ